MRHVRHTSRLRKSWVAILLIAIAIPAFVLSGSSSVSADSSSRSKAKASKSSKAAKSKAAKAKAAKAKAARKRAARSGYIIPPPLKDLGRDYKVRLVYFVPSDKEVKNEYREKIEVLMQVVSDIYRRDLNKHGHETRGLDFEFDDEGDFKVHLIKGDKPSVFYTGQPYSVDRLLESTKQEVLFKLGNPTGRACLIFSEAGGIAEAQPAYPYCGFAMVSGDMLRDEITKTDIVDQVESFFDTRPVRTKGSKKAESLAKERQVSNGVLIHELGHIFFMLHDTRHRDRNIMASGYHSLAKMFNKKTAKQHPVRFSPEHALIASATRFLSEKFDERDSQPPAAAFSLVRQPRAGEQKIQFKLDLKDNAGLHSVICMQRGGGGIDALVGGARLKGKVHNKVMTFTSPHVLVEGQPLIYIMNVMDKNGNCAQTVQQSYVAAGPKRKKK